MGAQAKDIANWLKEDAPLASSAALAEAVEQHPYASILHFAYLRALQNEDSYKFPAQLHRTALTAMNRQALLDWAESPLIPVEVQAAAWKEAQKPVAAVDVPKPAAATPAPAPALSSSAAEVPVPVPTKPVEAPKPAPAVASAPAPVSAPATTPAAVPVPASSLSSPTAVKPVAPKPAAPTDLSSINLDALPPAVREQVLRSRAIQEKLGKAPVEKPVAAPVVKPVVPPTANPVEPKEPAAAAPIAPVVPKTDVPPVAPKAPEVSAELAAPISEPQEAASPPASEPVKAPVTNVSEEPIAEGAAAPTTKDVAPKEPKQKAFVPDPGLSPFANFLSSLKDESPASAVPTGQRDPAMERAILEQFLEINPKIKPVRDAPLGENLALRTPNVSGLVTETLANHYYDQGMHEKAIQAYEILKLKVPEKSVIFAARISEMRKTQSSTK